MSPRDLFAVLLKAIGVWEAIAGFLALATMGGHHYVRMITQTGGFFVASQFPMNDRIFSFLLPSARTIVGCLLFVAADWLAAKTYPTKPMSTPLPPVD